MKTVKLLFLTVLTLLMGFKAANPGLNDADRKYASELLTSTKETLLKTVKGLTQEQLDFKASPDSWSIANCIEHIAKSETLLWGTVDGAMKSEADDDAKSAMTDEAVVGMITNRDQKFKTREPFEPTGAFGSAEGALKEFTSKRDEHIKYIKSTNDDMRGHFADMPFGKLDAFQTVLFLAGHSKRHTLQIEEVKADANFPKGKKGK